MKMSTTVNNDSLSIEIPKKPANKSASEHRKATKPIMEKRRRARINHSLDELKSLILDALHKDPSRHSKLEKADILEMTVRYLQNTQNQNHNAKSKYAAGFTECASMVERFLNRPGVDDRLKLRLMDHLSNCMSNVQNSGPINNSFPTNVAFPGMVPPQENNSPLRVQIPYSSVLKSSNDINNNQTSIESKLTTPPSSASSTMFTFTFPPHANLPTPPTPRTPNTPTNRALNINISYNNSANTPSNVSPNHFRFGSMNAWNRLSTSSPPHIAGSLSPSSCSVRSLSPVGSESHDDIDRHVLNLKRIDGLNEGRDRSMWRP
ncbi:deadpan-like protein, partial [Leptotrombidium deliense]